MDKRYQVFVSSTYADLKEERQHVTQALMEMDCIPAGMELFPATDEEQWEFIKRIIDDCDYYLLIIGGRYGSTIEEGISYTEKEYDYAVEKGLKVVALIHENPDDIPVGKSDISPEIRAKLKAFREKVSGNRLVKYWNKAGDLPGLVALSLSKTIKTFPATGWVRASEVSNEDLLAELNELRKENSGLKIDLSKLQQSPSYKIEGLAGLDETFTINGSQYVHSHKRAWVSTLTWSEIFSIVAPYLIQHPNEKQVKSVLLSAIQAKEELNGVHITLEDQDLQTISIQLKSHGLIRTRYSKTTSGSMALFWTLTPKGERLMVQLRVIPSKK